MNYDRFLNPQITAVPPSGIRRFFDLAATMKDTISLGVGEPDFKTPYHIRNAAIDSLVDGETQYTANRGLPELRQEIALYLSDRYGISYDPAAQILVTIGASEAIDLALRVISSPGDEILVPEPSYVSYSPGVIFAGATPVGVETLEKDDFRLTASGLEKAITPRTKALILPYPNNPTGAVMSREDLQAVAAIVKAHDLFVISDEIYSELTYKGEHKSIAQMPGMKDRTILINGFSKAYAMTGWRLGYAAGPREIMKQMTKIHQFAIMCAPTTSQYAAVEALRNGDEDIAAMREAYNERRRFLVSELKNLGMDCFEPFGAFYVFPSIKRFGLSSDEFATRLLKEEKLAIVPGNAFGDCGEGFLRISYAYSLKDLKKALTRLKRFVAKLDAERGVAGAKKAAEQ